MAMPQCLVVNTWKEKGVDFEFLPTKIEESEGHLVGVVLLPYHLNFSVNLLVILATKHQTNHALQPSFPFSTNNSISIHPSSSSIQQHDPATSCYQCCIIVLIVCRVSQHTTTQCPALRSISQYKNSQLVVVFSSSSL